MKDAWKVALARTDAGFAPAIQQPNQMSRNQDHKQTSAEPNGSRPGKQQSEHVSQGRWRGVRAGTAYQNLQTRFQCRIREIVFCIALGRIKDGRDNNVGVLGPHRIKQSRDIGRHLIVGLELQPSRNFIPKIDAETGQLVPLFHDEGGCGRRNGADL